MGAYFRWKEGPRHPARSVGPGRKLLARPPGNECGLCDEEPLTQVKQSGQVSTGVWGPIQPDLRGERGEGEGAARGQETSGVG